MNFTLPPQTLLRHQTHALLITPQCLGDLEKHKAYARTYNAVLSQLARDPQRVGRHALRGIGKKIQVFDSAISGDLRLCWSYGDHMGEPVIILWALDGHDRVFHRVGRMSGDYVQRVEFNVDLSASTADHIGDHDAPINVGDAETRWDGVRPPAFNRLAFQEQSQRWCSEQLALSDEQALEAIKGVEEGPCLLSGGGGSGKTTLLIYKLINLIQENPDERPLLITYHSKLAEHCKTLIKDHHLREVVMKHIVTFDEVVATLRGALGIGQTPYLSQEDAKRLFTSLFPERNREAAWAEFRGMWKGRVDVDRYREIQREIETLEQALRGELEVDLEGTRAGERFTIRPSTSQRGVKHTAKTKLSAKERREAERADFLRRHPKHKVKDESKRDREIRESQAAQVQDQTKKRKQLKRALDDRLTQLNRASSEYLISDHTYSKDLRYLSAQDHIEGAFEEYERRAAERGGDRFSACLEILTRADATIHERAGGWTYMLIDEVQDFAQLELQLLSLLVPDPRRWMFAGDENQIVNPSGFRWERVKEVIWWRRQRNAQEHPHLSGAVDVDPAMLACNYRNPKPVQQLASEILNLKRADHWAPRELNSDARRARARHKRRWTKAEELTLDQTQINAEDLPWAWSPHSTLINSREDLVSFIYELSLNVPSMSVLVFSQEERDALVRELQDHDRRHANRGVTGERVLTPLQAKGLEFELILSLDQPLPTHPIEGIRDFEYNQLYVTSTRARTSLVFLWTAPEEELKFLAPFCEASSDGGEMARCDAGAEPPSDDDIVYATRARVRLLAQLHEAKDDYAWIEVAELRYQEGELAHAAELFHLGKDYTRAAEVYEELGRYGDATRDFKLAGLPVDALRCEAKRAEAEGQIGESFTLWERYAESSYSSTQSDTSSVDRDIHALKGVWRTLSGPLPERSVAGVLAQLGGDRPQRILSPLTRDLPSAQRGDADPILGFDERDQAKLVRSLAQRGRWWALHQLQPSEDWAGRHLSGEARGASHEKSGTRRLRRLKRSPDLGELRKLCTSDELPIESLFDDDTLSGQRAGDHLDVSDCEFLLGFVDHFHDRGDSGRDQSGDQRPFRGAWSNLNHKLDSRYGVHRLASGGLKDRGLICATRIANQLKRNHLSEGFKASLTGIRASLSGAKAYWGEQLRVVHTLQRQGLFYRDSAYDPGKKPIHYARFEDTLRDASSLAGLSGLESGSLSYSARAPEVWRRFESMQEVHRDLSRLIALMPYLRVSNTPLRLTAAERFSELWVHLVYLCSAYWRQEGVLDVVKPLEAEVLERCARCPLDELSALITTWSERVWADAGVRVDQIKGGSRRDQTTRALREILTYLFQINELAEALFLRGTWSFFINAKLKRAERLTGFGYMYLSAAHSHWTSMHYIPLFGVIGAWASHAKRVTLRAAQGRLKSARAKAKSARASLDERLEALKVEREELNARNEALGIKIKTDLVDEEQRALEEALSRCEAEVSHAAAQVAEAQTLHGHIMSQRHIIELHLAGSDVTPRRHPRLSDEDFAVARVSWRGSRQWSRLIFDTGARELERFLPLLNAYRGAHSLHAFKLSDFVFNVENTRKVVEPSAPSLWASQLPAELEPINSASGSTAPSGLPSAPELLSFALSQAYTPLAIELLDHPYYFERTRASLSVIDSWSDQQRQEARGTLNILGVTPRGQKTEWLSTGYAMIEGDLATLFTSADPKWARELLREMHARAPQEVPQLLSVSLMELMTLWNTLTAPERERARALILWVAQLWDTPTAEALLTLFVSRDPASIARAYREGEKWLLMSPLARDLISDRGHAHQGELLARLILMSERR